MYTYVYDGRMSRTVYFDVNETITAGSASSKVSFQAMVALKDSSKFVN